MYKWTHRWLAQGSDCLLDFIEVYTLCYTTILGIYYTVSWVRTWWLRRCFLSNSCFMNLNKKRRLLQSFLQPIKCTKIQIMLYQWFQTLNMFSIFPASTNAGNTSKDKNNEKHETGKHWYQIRADTLGCRVFVERCAAPQHLWHYLLSCNLCRGTHSF